MNWICVFAVTAVESAGRALQYLGLDGDKSAVGFDVRTFCPKNWNNRSILLCGTKQSILIVFLKWIGVLICEGESNHDGLFDAWDDRI